MKYIRIFVNDLGLRAFSVFSDDLYSFCILRDVDFDRNVEDARRYIPSGFHAIGSLTERTQVTFRFLRDGNHPDEIALPNNLDKLGFDF